MAGAAYTGTPPRVLRFTDQLGAFSTSGGQFTIKNAEIINQGDLVGLDTNNLVVVASKTTGAIIKPVGVAVFDLRHDAVTSLTGDGSTTKCSIYRKATIGSLTSTYVPSLSKQGQPVFLGPVPTATVSNYTCAITSTASDEVVPVGVSTDGVTIEVDCTQGGFINIQASGSTTIAPG